MQRIDLEHVIRASCAHLGDNKVLILGSQSILGTYEDYELPEAATASDEADVAPFVDDSVASLSNVIDGGMGELSDFHSEFGYYAQGVSISTSVLPAEWERRLVPVCNDNTRYCTGWCLDVHDLCSAKLIAGRSKDLRFVGALAHEDLISVPLLCERITKTDLAIEVRDAALIRAAGWGDNSARYVPPSVPYASLDDPNHPANFLSAEARRSGTRWASNLGGRDAGTCQSTNTANGKPCGNRVSDGGSCWIEGH